MSTQAASFAVTPADVERAAEVLRPYLPPTPLHQSFALTEKAGCPVFLKIETTQPTRSFKVRGAMNRVIHLSA
ncbi:MAG: pyridoxal-phosphate dependent enzyme, partial [Candidatus Dormibacteraceae bacterium]